jgi:hypothetical protein
MRVWREDVMGPYTSPALAVSNSGYTTLVLPWSPETDAATGALYDQASFLRHEFPVDSAMNYGSDLLPDNDSVNWKRVEAALNTMSAAPKWRKDHPDLANTDKDCVTHLINQIKDVMGEDAKGRDIKACMQGSGTPTVFLAVKRKSGE